jgi:hypothetical protein
MRANGNPVLQREADRFAHDAWVAGVKAARHVHGCHAWNNCGVMP